MKILMLFSNSNIGGAEKSLSRMVLNNKNHDFELASMDGEGPWTEWIKDNGRTPIFFGNKKNLTLNYFNLFFFLKKNKFDIIYVCGIRASIFLRFIKLYFKFKLINGIRWSPANKDFKTNKYFYLLEYTTSFLVDGYISNSKIGKFFLTDNINIPNEKVFSIYNGVNTKSDSKLLNTDKQNIISIVANLAPRKGHIQFLDVIKQVIELAPDTIFYFIGRDEMNGEVQKKINQENLSKNVLILGFKKNIKEWISKSKLVVLPSLWGEGCPTSILEANSLAVPSIAYDIDGINELIINNHTGFIIKKFNKKEFAEKILYLLKNNEVLKVFNSNCFLNIQNNYTLNKCVDKHNQVFDNIYYNSHNNKNILIVINSLDIGGTENHILNTFKKINILNFNINIFVIKPGGSLEPKFRDNNLELIQSNGNFFTVMKKLYKYISVRNTIVHCFLPKSYLLGGVISILSSNRNLIMSRRSRNIYQKKRFVASYIEKLLHKKLKIALANSKRVYQDLLVEGVKKSNLKILYNGVNTDDFRPNEILRKKIREKLNINQKKIVFICVANFIKYKGHDDIIEAINKIKKTFKENCTMIFVGKENNKLENIKANLIKYNLNENFIFMDHNTEVKNIIPACDLGVLASHEEGFSNFVLECLSSGLPLIASRVGGNDEVIKSDENGYLFEPKNVNELSKLIENIILKKDSLKRLSIKARDTVLKDFDINNTAINYIKLYKKIFELK